MTYTTNYIPPPASAGLHETKAFLKQPRVPPLLHKKFLAFYIIEDSLQHFVSSNTLGWLNLLKPSGNFTYHQV
jgi:hypothetical protein